MTEQTRELIDRIRYLEDRARAEIAHGIVSLQIALAERSNAVISSDAPVVHIDAVARMIPRLRNAMPPDDMRLVANILIELLKWATASRISADAILDAAWEAVGRRPDDGPRREEMCGENGSDMADRG